MNRIALITGATSGFGEATARLLSQNNFSLIVTGRREERLNKLVKELTEMGTEVLPLCFDIRNREEVEAAIANLPKQWNTIDVLINNAGLAVGTEPLYDAIVDDWERMIDTNLKGLLYLSRVVSKKMVERKSGHIINISSIAGKEAYPGGSVYCASKHGIQAITKAMRIELLPFNIKVSSLCPGMAETEFSNVRFKGNDTKADNVYKGVTPLYANDIAETILFLVTRPAHVNIDDLLIMPTAQASARDVYREQQ